MIDHERMYLQELKDFQTTERIMKNIFNKYGLKVELIQNPLFSHIDTKLMVNKKHRYNIEIKERTQDMEKYKTLPLKVKKYINILKCTEKNIKPLVIYLVNNEEYYIFNLREIDLNKCEFDNWFINKVEFDKNQIKDEIPTLFIPICQAIYKGKIQ